MAQRLSLGDMLVGLKLSPTSIINCHYDGGMNEFNSVINRGLGSVNACSMGLVVYGLWAFSIFNLVMYVLGVTSSHVSRPPVSNPATHINT